MNQKLQTLIDTALVKLKEPGSWAGIVVVISAVVRQMRPEVASAIEVGGPAVVGCILIYMKG